MQVVGAESGSVGMTAQAVRREMGQETQVRGRQKSQGEWQGHVSVLGILSTQGHQRQGLIEENLSNRKSISGLLNLHLDDLEKL